MSKLSWNGKDPKKLHFPPKVWHYIEMEYGQFATGDHAVTKAYHDFISLTDEYDFAWDADGRLWCVYAKTAGEIHLVRSDADLTEWESDNLLAFAPSGSRKPALCLLPNGHYEVAVEIEPAGEAVPEVWLMSYPYNADQIRKICFGMAPKLLWAFGEQYIFYNRDEYTICVRSSSDGFMNEYTVEVSTEPIHIKKVVTIAGADRGHIVLFYWRDNDMQPLKYLDASSYFFDAGSATVSVMGLEWVKCETYLSDIDDSTDASISLLGIEWVYVGPIETNSADSGQAEISIRNIEWVDIQTIPANIADQADATISLQSILWVEV